jgi:PKD repeat protein
LPPMLDICTGFEFLSGFGTAKAGAGVVRAGFASGFSFTAEFAGAALTFVIGDLDIPQSTEDQALALGQHVACRTRDMYRDIANDPADPAYLTVAQPVFENLPLSIAGAAQDAVSAFDSVQAYGDAERVAFERYQAAVADANEIGVRLQSDAVSTFGEALVHAMHDAAGAATAYGEELDGEAGLNNPVLTAQSLQDILAIRGRVTQDGFTAAELQELTSAGLSPAAIDALRATFAEDVSGAPIDVSIKQVLDDAAKALEDAIPAFDLIAREMAVVSAVTIAPSFSAEPATGEAPLEVTFTDTSTPAGLATTWAFGDGSGGQGTPITHTFLVPGDYTVTLSVTDGTRSDVTTKIVTVTGNHPPEPVADIIATTRGASVALNVLRNDTDPDGDSLAVTATTAGFGLFSCQANGDCAYEAPADVGGDAASYTVSDGEASSVGQVAINVTTGSPYRTGELFAGQYGGGINRVSPQGDLIERLTTFPTGRAIQTGMCFDAAGDLYTTNFNGTMSKFGPNGVLLEPVWADGAALGDSSDPESCVVMPDGDVLVGEADGDSRRLRRLTSDGDLVASFATAFDERGNDWIDLAADGCTVYYTSEGDRILRYNVCTDEQAADFATGLPGPCYALRVRDDGGVIVACQSIVVRFGPDGDEIQRYDPEANGPYPGAQFYFAMNLDPDGTSFWSAGYNSGIGSKVDIETGDVLASYQLTDAGGGIFNGLAVFGELLASRNHPPVGLGDSYEVGTDGTLTVPVATGVLANDSDSDGDTLTAAKASEPTHGSVAFAQDGSFSYMPDIGFAGADMFTYDVSDGKVSVGPITVSIEVGAANRAPTVQAVEDSSIPEMVAFTQGLSASDADGDTLTYSVVSGPAGLTVDPATGVVSWTPAEAQGPGTYGVTLRATDPGQLFGEATFDLAVLEVNRNPAIDPISDRTTHPTEPVSLQASASDPDIPANSLTFSLVAGPSGASVTSAGAFSWTPSVDDVSDHTITIAVSDGAGGSSQTSFTVHVVRDATVLAIGGDQAGQYSDHATITATLTSDGEPLASRPVTVSFGGQTATVSTDSAGVARAAFSIPGPAGSLVVQAAFAGTPAYEPSNASGTFSVRREDAILESDGQTTALVGNSIALRATLIDSASAAYGGPAPETSDPTLGEVSNARVAFDVFPAATCLSGTPLATLTGSVVDTGTTGDGVGSASATWSSTSEGSFCVVPRLIGTDAQDSNGFYVAPPSEPAGLAVYANTAGHVTGGGWIAVDGRRDNFGFNARASGTKPPKGQMVFVERTLYRGSQVILIVKSNSIESLRTTGSTPPITATLDGKATIRYISALDGSTLFESGNLRFTATVIDTDGRGSAGDAFGIRLVDKAGAVVIDVPVTVLGGGNIVAHLK